MSWHNDNPTNSNDYEERDMVIIDRYPSEAVADSYLDLLTALLRVALDIGVIGVAVAFIRAGSVPALLDAAGGRIAWLIAGAVVGLFVLDEVPEAINQAGQAAERCLEVRVYARHILGMPLAERLVVIPTRELDDASQIPPAGLRSADEVTGGKQ
jgi:hypothetical protein